MLRLGIVGSGFGLYGLFPAFRSVKGCTVVALCGQKRPQLTAYCESIGFDNLYEDWREMFEKEELDAVALAVTPSAQYEIASAAIKRGWHVFAEKPLAETLPKARALLALATKKKITHGVDFIFPEIAAWKKAKELIDGETYGKLVHLSVAWEFLSYAIRTGEVSWKTDAAKGGGALSYYFSHGLHYIEHFAGPVRSVRAAANYAKESKNGAETAMNMLLTFGGGRTGFARVCCNSRGMPRHRLEFHCEKGVLVLENDGRVVDGFTLTVQTPDGTRTLKVPGDKGRRGEDERVKIVAKNAKRFVDACKTSAPMTPSFREGVRVQELIAQVRSAAA